MPTLVSTTHRGERVIGNWNPFLREQHNKDPNGIAANFKIPKECQNKLDCLIFEMLSIKELKPNLTISVT